LELRIHVNELDVQTAQASYECDKKRIDEAIEKQGGYEELNKYIINCIKDRGNILFDGECLEALRKMDELLVQFSSEKDEVQKKRICQRAQDLAMYAMRQQARMSKLSPQQHNEMLKDHEAKLQKLLEAHEARLKSLDDADEDDEEVAKLKKEKRDAEMEVLANKREQSLLLKLADLNEGATRESKAYIHEEVDQLQIGIDEALKRHMEALKAGFEQKMVELLDARDNKDKSRFQEAAKQVMQSLQVARAFGASNKSAPPSISVSAPSTPPTPSPVAPRRNRTSLTPIRTVE